MNTPFTTAFLHRAFSAAKVSGHIFPDYAACEAALESNWGRSELCVKGNNLFGSKLPSDRIIPKTWGAIVMPTKEFLHDKWVTIEAKFVAYPGWTNSFTDRMYTLNLLSSSYPHYANALKATSGQEFVEEVSKSWSTDPLRAKKVEEIHNVHKGVFSGDVS